MPQISNPRLHPSSGNLRKAEGHRSFFFDEKRAFQDAVSALKCLDQSIALNTTYLPEIVRRILVPMEQDRSGDGELSKLSTHALALAQNRYSSRFFPCADKVITRSTAFLIFWLYAATHSFAEIFQKLGDPCAVDRQAGSVQYAQGGRLKELPFRNWLAKMLPGFQEDDLFKNLKPYFNDFFVSESRIRNSEYFVQLKGQKFSLKPNEIKYPKFDCSSDSKESQSTSSRLFDSSSLCQTETAPVHEADCQTIGNPNEAGIQATLESADGQCQAHIIPEVFSSICQATTEIRDAGCQFTPEFTKESAVQATAAAVSLGCQFELSTRECATEPVNMPTSEKGLQVDLNQEEPFSFSLPGSAANSVIIPAKSSNHSFSARAHRHRKRSSRFAQLRRSYLEYLNRKMNREKSSKKQEKIAQIVNKGVSQGLKSVLETITVQAAQGGASLIIGDNNFIVRRMSDSVMAVDRFEDLIKQQQEIEKAATEPLAQLTDAANFIEPTSSDSVMAADHLDAITAVKSVLITQAVQTDNTDEATSWSSYSSVAEKHAKKLANELTKERGEELVKKVARDLVEALDEKVARGFVKELARGLDERRADELANELAKKRAKQLAKKVARGLVKALNGKVARELVEELVEELAKGLDKEGDTQFVKELEEELVKELAAKRAQESAKMNAEMQTDSTSFVAAKRAQQLAEVVASGLVEALDEKLTKYHVKQLVQEIVEQLAGGLDEKGDEQFVKKFVEEISEQLDEKREKELAQISAEFDEIFSSAEFDEIFSSRLKQSVIKHTDNITSRPQSNLTHFRHETNRFAVR